MVMKLLLINPSLCTAVANANVAIDAHIDVHMPIVAVSVKRCYDTCALLDPASSSSVCTQTVVDMLDLQGQDVDYVLNTLGASGEMKFKVVSLELSSPDGWFGVVVSIMCLCCRFHSG